MSVPACPATLPASLEDAAKAFANDWSSSHHRPRPTSKVAQDWQELLRTWIATPDLPLYVRKHDRNRGREYVHCTGRSIVPVDNSTAHWAYTLAVTGTVPTIAELRSAISQDQIPILLTRSSAERTTAKYHCALRAAHAVNKKGWKLAHIQGVGLRVKTPLDQIAIASIESHFVRLLDPLNMFLVPKHFSGLAEVPAVISIMSTVRP